MKWAFSVSLSIFSLICMKSLYADNIRGPIVEEIVLSPGQLHDKEYSLRLEELMVISIDPDSRFLMGVDVEISIPEQIQRYRDSFALLLFKGIEPDLQKDVWDYRGERILFTVIPSMRRLFIRIPIIEKANFRAAPGTVFPEKPVSLQEFPIIITILPVMKGIPGSVEESIFKIKANPILEERGILLLKIETEGNKQIPEDMVSVYIDEKRVPYPESEYILDAGIHRLKVEAGNYKSKSVSFGIEKSQKRKLTVTLERDIPKLFLEAPENTVVFLDGEKIDFIRGKPIEIEEGEHTILFKIGDYTLSKKFAVERGNTYTVMLFLDILVQKD